MATITFYYKKDDVGVDEIKDQLLNVQNEIPFNLIDICLDEDEDLSSRFDDRTPSLQIGPYRLTAPFDEINIRVALNAVKDREAAIDPEVLKKRNQNLMHISGLEKFSYWLSRYYMLFISAVLALFLFFPFLAPVLMKNGQTSGATVIYKVYKIFCHELAYRSFYLYGEQLYYPRELANISGVITYEQATGMSAQEIDFARDFVGNEATGYKIAICERDIAIYGSFLLAALLFQFTGKKLKALPWYFWVLIALVPIGLDGVSQIPSLSSGWPTWLPIRESTPLLRVLTGALFGFGTSWFIYPLMEESMVETRSAMSQKMAIKKKLIKQGRI